MLPSDTCSEMLVEDPFHLLRAFQVPFTQIIRKTVSS